jgi:hypothetical protein
MSGGRIDRERSGALVVAQRILDDVFMTLHATARQPAAQKIRQPRQRAAIDCGEVD